MFESYTPFLKKNQGAISVLLQHYLSLDKQLMLKSDLWDAYVSFCEKDGMEYLLEDNPLKEIVSYSQESVIISPWICVGIRPSRGRWIYIRVHLEEVKATQISVQEYLRFKERIISKSTKDITPLEVDFTPFERDFPKLRKAKSIGQGVSFLNIQLSNKLFQAIDKEEHGLIDFLRVHQYKGRQLMLKKDINNFNDLRRALRKADTFLSKRRKSETWDDIASYMASIGFLPGWGRSIARIYDTINLLSDILEAPDPKHLEEFLSRIPMIFNLVSISPHGYFAQNNVIGLPDTGGQVIYILNQVIALEKEMYKRLWEQGLDIEPKIVVITRLIPNASGTSCDKRNEKIEGTKNAQILRVPFREENGDIVEDWISRFEVWPYLERFSHEVEKEILSYLGGRPDLIIGNYSDGNLVATLLSRSLKVTQCNIAHALEKTKYLFSALYWKEMEEHYHFSCQFTADVIAMNSADFIITSTYQEIAGEEGSVGQYESYSSFTMPSLYRIVRGIDIFDPKFNIVSPGADPEVYFPYYDKTRRLTKFHADIEKLIYEPSRDNNSRGNILHKKKPLIFTIARLDRIKNVTGLASWFGKSKRLRKHANLLIVAGHVDVARASDTEEKEQAELMHKIMDEYKLDKDMKWLGALSDKEFNGELYRFIADGRGIFVQPALFEAFGLTIIEAMSTGLPTFATCYGGPLEIIEDEVSGFHIDPNHADKTTNIIVDFFDRCKKDKNYWTYISKQSIERIVSKYTWELYAKRMMTLSRIYGFWKFATNLERLETHMYLDMFYSLQFRVLADTIKKDVPKES